MMDLMIVINIGDGDSMMVWVMIDYKMSTENVIVSKEEKERNK